MKAPEPTPENLEKARACGEDLYRAAMTVHLSGMCPNRRDHRLPSCNVCVRVATGFAELRRDRDAAVERAAKRIEKRADSLREWMLTLPIRDPARTDKSLRAAELYEAAKLVREV